MADFCGLEVFPAFGGLDFAGEGGHAVGEKLPGVAGVFGIDGPFPFDLVLAGAVEDDGPFCAVFFAEPPAKGVPFGHVFDSITGEAALFCPEFDDTVFAWTDTGGHKGVEIGRWRLGLAEGGEVGQEIGKLLGVEGRFEAVGHEGDAEGLEFGNVFAGELLLGTVGEAEGEVVGGFTGYHTDVGLLGMGLDLVR